MLVWSQLFWSGWCKFCCWIWHFFIQRFALHQIQNQTGLFQHLARVCVHRCGALGFPAAVARERTIRGLGGQDSCGNICLRLHRTDLLCWACTGRSAGNFWRQHWCWGPERVSASASLGLLLMCCSKILCFWPYLVADAGRLTLWAATDPWDGARTESPLAQGFLTGESSLLVGAQGAEFAVLGKLRLNWNWSSLGSVCHVHVMLAGK